MSVAVQLPESLPAPAAKPKLLDQLRMVIRALHYSHKTEEAYVHWVRRYILFHDKRHPTGLNGTYRLIATLLYGCGLRQIECLRLLWC
jgi:hypothetical protein